MTFTGGNNKSWKMPEEEREHQRWNDMFLPKPRSQLTYPFSMSVSLGHNPAPRIYMAQNKECSGETIVTHSQFKAMSRTFKRFRQFVVITTYANTVGRHPQRYFPFKKSKHGKGLCCIFLNHADKIPGVESDVKGLEKFYQNTAHFTVCGGQNDPNKENCRNIGRGDLYDILAQINHQYDKSTVISGTEYDRIIIHFFSYGDRDNLITPDNTNWSKIAILQDIDKAFPNLQHQIPVIVFLHSHTARQLMDAEKQALSPMGNVINSDNIMGLFSVSQPIRRYNQRDEGSWIFQELLHELNYNHAKMHLTDMIAKVNHTAEKRSHPCFIGVTNGFKELHLTMPEEFFHNE